MTSVEQRLPAWAAQSASGVLVVPARLRPGRHRASGRALFSLRRLFYVARHRRM